MEPSAAARKGLQPTLRPSRPCDDVSIPSRTMASLRVRSLRALQVAPKPSFSRILRWIAEIQRKAANESKQGGKSMSDRHVVVVDVNMPFWSMVWFMVKWAIAAIPAGIILALAYMLVMGILGGFGAAIISTLAQ